MTNTMVFDPEVLYDGLAARIERGSTAIADATGYAPIEVPRLRPLRKRDHLTHSSIAWVSTSTMPDGTEVVIRRYCPATLTQHFTIDELLDGLARPGWLPTDKRLREGGILPTIGVSAYRDEHDGQTYLDLIGKRHGQDIDWLLVKMEPGPREIAQILTRTLPIIAQDIAIAHTAGYELGDVVNPKNLLYDGKNVAWSDAETVRLGAAWKGRVPEETLRALNACKPDRYTTKFASRRQNKAGGYANQQDDIESFGVMLAYLAFGLHQDRGFWSGGTHLDARDMFIYDDDTDMLANELGMPGLDVVAKKAMQQEYCCMHAVAEDLHSICAKYDHF